MKENEKSAEEYEELKKIISAVDEVMENTALLDNIKSEKELEQVMPVLLASLGKYAQADSPLLEIIRADITNKGRILCRFLPAKYTPLFCHPFIHIPGLFPGARAFIHICTTSIVLHDSRTGIYSAT